VGGEMEGSLDSADYARDDSGESDCRVAHGPSGSGLLAMTR